MGYEVIRWLSGEVQTGEGVASTARHLYKDGRFWCGVMSGMTDDMEKEILDALNRKDEL